MTKDEALKLALSTLDEVRSETFRLMRNGQTLYAEEKVWSTITAIKEALAQPAQEPKDIAVLVQGMAVSVDVSTGDHDQGHRLFGTVTLVQESQKGKHGLILLVQDPQPNFKAQRKPWVDLTDEEIQAVAKKARSKDHAVTLTNKFLRDKNT